MRNEETYFRIINYICQQKKITEEELFKVLKDRKLKYLLFHTLKNYGCTDKETLLRVLKISSKGSINNNFRRAQERFFVSRDFREEFFKIEKDLDKII